MALTIDDPSAAARPEQRTGQKLADYIKVYDGALEPAICDAMVARFELDTANQEQVDYKQIRRFAVLDVSQSAGWRDMHDLLFQGLVAAVERYVADCAIQWIPPNQGIEDFRIKRYRPGTGEEFKPHVDISNADLARRMIVAFWYLNDVAEGGETEFVSLGLAVKPKKGRLLMFPPTFLYPHAGRPPRSNSKYIVGSYTRYE
jgi:prolyl 4-hydroxylase